MELYVPKGQYRSEPDWVVGSVEVRCVPIQEQGTVKQR
jgi:hypothetical protein